MKKEFLKKIITLTCFYFLLVGLFVPARFSLAVVGPCNPPTVPNADFTACVQPTRYPTDTYQFLAPLPCEKGTVGCTDKGLETFDTVGENKIGLYLNTMIRIFIGLCAVLAVVMIVMGGIEYMTSELVSSKEAGKERIRNAIFGLLLALGAYALLFTINPDILNTELKSLGNVVVDVKLLQDELDGSPPSLTAYTGTPPGGPAPGCETGVVKSAATGVVACSNIAQSIDKMIADAKQANPPLTIWAGGYRTIEQQTALRIKNCNGNITDRNAPCSTPTALPGLSRHQGGQAFDVSCNGSTITSKSSPCFLWLQANASKYGLQNLIVGNEPWHWSTDGR